MLAWAVALVFCTVLVFDGATAPEPDQAPPDLAPVTSSTCVPATTSYPDGSVWHKCASTPPPAELPSPDPFTEE